jgi:hypothetical protein
MKRASTPITHTPPSSGLTDLTPAGGTLQVKGLRKRPPKIVLVVACAQRKRISPPVELRLSSIDAGPDERSVEWSRRIREVEASQHCAQDLYVGDHWRAACEAYGVAQQYSNRAELWVISAGYGLIPSSKLIKPYGATFATRSADSVWRGPSEGDRGERLRQWWGELEHEVALADLLPTREDGAVVIAAGAAYLAALDADLGSVLRREANHDRVSVISAGTKGDGVVLPVSGRFRAGVGGTDSSLNARTLALLARSATEHQFRRSAMAATLVRMASALPSTTRRAGRTTEDVQIARRIREMRKRDPGISRTGALRELRNDGIACEQARFRSIWRRVVGEPRQ